ncbi:MAG: hypothetical protein ABSC21_04650 [Terriglobia bacterium]|jgi:hypothetical protein
MANQKSSKRSTLELAQQVLDFLKEKNVSANEALAVLLAAHTGVSLEFFQPISR